MAEPEGQRTELIGGEVVAMWFGHIPHEVVKSNLIEILSAWIAKNRSHRLLSETMFQLDEYSSPIPDISLVLRNRVAAGATGVFQGAPELAVEVVSSETAARLEAKIELYLAHGGQSVWTAFPEQRIVRVFDSQGQGRKFEQNQVLEDPVHPGLQIPVTAIFEGL